MNGGSPWKFNYIGLGVLLLESEIIIGCSRMPCKAPPLCLEFRASLTNSTSSPVGRAHSEPLPLTRFVLEPNILRTSFIPVLVASLSWTVEMSANYCLVGENTCVTVMELHWTWNLQGLSAKAMPFSIPFKGPLLPLVGLHLKHEQK